jgi:hypothetical protein
MVEELRMRLVVDKDTREAAVFINPAKNMTLYIIADGINAYIAHLNDEDSTVRLKDVIVMNDSKFQIEVKPLQLLLLQDQMDYAIEMIKDTLRFAKMYYFKKQEEEKEDKTASKDV